MEKTLKCNDQIPMLQFPPPMPLAGAITRECPLAAAGVKLARPGDIKWHFAGAKRIKCTRQNPPGIQSPWAVINLTDNVFIVFNGGAEQHDFRKDGQRA